MSELSARPIQPDSSVTVLSVSAISEDHTTLRGLLRGLPCRLVVASTCRNALRCLSHDPTCIIICERDLPDGTWRDVLNHLGASATKPFLIVTSPVADEALWAEVLNLGGFDVIAKPFDQREVRHVLETACLRRPKLAAVAVGSTGAFAA